MCCGCWHSSPWDHGPIQFCLQHFPHSLEFQWCGPSSASIWLTFAIRQFQKECLRLPVLPRVNTLNWGLNQQKTFVSSLPMNAILFVSSRNRMWNMIGICQTFKKQTYVTWVWAITLMTLQYFFIFSKSCWMLFFPWSSDHLLLALKNAFFLLLYLSNRREGKGVEPHQTSERRFDYRVVGKVSSFNQQRIPSKGKWDNQR